MKCQRVAEMQHYKIGTTQPCEKEAKPQILLPVCTRTEFTQTHSCGCDKVRSI